MNKPRFLDSTLSGVKTSTHAELETESQVMQTLPPFHQHAALINDLKDIQNRDWQVTIAHTLREANSCADMLAKVGATREDNLSIHQVPF
ncbi:hypothetical protein E2542_SST26782 [Spatholobus suberectus]|nr:hypothetical protein E2542_SST26782 [Spatholobus suberectus]